MTLGTSAAEFFYDESPLSFRHVFIFKSKDDNSMKGKDEIEGVERSFETGEDDGVDGQSIPQIHAVAFSPTVHDPSEGRKDKQKEGQPSKTEEESTSDIEEYGRRDYGDDDDDDMNRDRDKDGDRDKDKDKDGDKDKDKGGGRDAEGHLAAELFRESTPETDISEIIIGTGDKGEPIVSLRNPEEYREPQLQDVQKVRLVKHAMTEVDDNNNDGADAGVGDTSEDGKSKSKRLSDTGIIGHTEGLTEFEEPGSSQGGEGGEGGEGGDGDDGGVSGREIETEEIGESQSPQLPVITIQSSEENNGDNGNKDDR